MAGRRPVRPQQVAVSGLPSSGDPAVDRMTVQAEQDLQDLQDFARRTQTDVGDISAELDSLTATVAAIPTSGRLLTTLRLTGTGSGTLPAGTAVVILEGVGQGGGGGGAAGGAGVGVGGGGASGARLCIKIGTPGVPLANLAYSWTAGSAGGAAGADTGGNGGTGTDSTVTINGTTYTMKGGLGGTGGASSTTIAYSAGGSQQAGTTSGGHVEQEVGFPGVVTAGSAPALGWGGRGGGTAMGVGGGETSGGSAGAGGDTNGFGGAGAGGCSVGATGKAGGAGAPGGIELEVYG
jgi:hypothetical protein